MSWERLQQGPGAARPWGRWCPCVGTPVLWLQGKKWGRAGATQPLSPAHEVICSKPCGCSVKIINRAIKEAPVALGAMLCRGREGELRGGEGLLSTPFSCQIPSQLLGWDSDPGAEPRLSVAFPPPLLVRVFCSCCSSGFTCPPCQ